MLLVNASGSPLPITTARGPTLLGARERMVVRDGMELIESIHAALARGLLVLRPEPGDPGEPPTADPPAPTHLFLPGMSRVAVVPASEPDAVQPDHVVPVVPVVFPEADVWPEPEIEPVAPSAVEPSREPVALSGLTGTHHEVDPHD